MDDKSYNRGGAKKDELSLFVVVHRAPPFTIFKMNFRSFKEE